MQHLIQSLAWTFVHSLWQALLAALLAAVIISATGKTKARLRYNSMGIVFMLFLTVVVITFIDQFREIASSSSAIAITGNEAFINIADKSTEVISPGFIADLGAWFNNNTRLLMFVWAFFFLVNCMKLVAGLATVNRLRRHKIHPVNEDWKIKLQQLQDTLGIRRSITLLQSELIKVPVTIGFLKPVILLPVGLLTGIPPEQAEAILLHELGHIGRKDYLVNFFQHFAEAIFFFNPAVLWISSLLRQEREACCDDIVVARIGQKRNYLNALVSFQEYTFTHSPYAVGISSRRQYLLCRVKRIITNENKKLNLLEKGLLFSGLLLFSAFTYITQEKEKSDAPVTAPVEWFNNVQEINELSIRTILAEPAIQPTREEKKKTYHNYKPVTDTVPAKKDERVIPAPPLTTVKENNPGKPGPDAETVLEEIKQIKEQIGKKKESIGVKKDQLKEMKGNTKEEEALKDQIEKERREIEGIRSELEKKRVFLENLKKKNDKKEEKKNEMKNEIKNENKKEIKNEKKFENKSDQKNEMKNEKKFENKNDQKNEMKKQEDKIVLFQNRKTLLFKNRESKLFQNSRTKLIQYTPDTKQVQYVPGTKPTHIAAGTRTDKLKLLKASPTKPGEKKNQLNKDIQLKTKPPKPPGAEEKAKSLAPSGVKALPVPEKQH